MLLKIVYVLTCRVLGLVVLVFRSDMANDAGLLVLRQENAVLRRHAGGVRYEPAGRAWFAALARLIPRRPAAGTYVTGKRRKPGRPPANPGIARRVVRLARENPLRGHRRIHGEPAKSA